MPHLKSIVENAEGKALMFPKYRHFCATKSALQVWERQQGGGYPGEVIEFIGLQLEDPLYLGYSGGAMEERA